MKQTHIYISIDVKEVLPKINNWFWVLSEGKQEVLFFDSIDLNTNDWIGLDGEPRPVTHWLEKQDSSIVFTKEELIDTLADFAVELISKGINVTMYLQSKGIKL